MQENIFDVETFFEGLSIASTMNRELFFVAKFIDDMKAKGSDADVTSIVFSIIKEIDMDNKVRSLSRNEHDI